MLRITIVPPKHHDYATAESASAAFFAGESFVHVGTMGPISKKDIHRDIEVVIKYNRQQYRVVIPQRAEA